MGDRLETLHRRNAPRTMCIAFRVENFGVWVSALEATQGQMDGFFSRLPYKCHLEEVASVGDWLKICPQLDSKVAKRCHPGVELGANLRCAVQVHPGELIFRAGSATKLTTRFGLTRICITIFIAGFRKKNIVPWEDNSRMPSPETIDSSGAIHPGLLVLSRSVWGEAIS